ncbi:MAG: hypothetical protein RLZZ165_2161 [Bacteroidota bacterium]|jgi:hypothetical protein
MKKLALLTVLISGLAAHTIAQTQYKVVTAVESIIPMGLGRSRMIENKTGLNVNDFTTERVDGNDSKQGDVDRDDLKVNQFAETKLLNLFSGVGINFQNIASNDALVSSKLNQLTAEGWTLAFVTSGVESYAGKDDKGGIFITRYVFKK